MELTFTKYNGGYCVEYQRAQSKRGWAVAYSGDDLSTAMRVHRILALEADRQHTARTSNRLMLELLGGTQSRQYFWYARSK